MLERGADAFTFHYGPIQIKICLKTFTIFYDLHSTMVLFKLMVYKAKSEKILIYIPLWSYSNKKVCNLSKSDLKNLHSTMVLFK